MTDRELLELAAKAAEYHVDGFACKSIVNMDDDLALLIRNNLGGNSIWNPLRSDGDALRMAVKLRLHVSVFADAIGIGTPTRCYEESKWTDDPYAATRRAIVRAAAEIGKAIE